MSLVQNCNLDIKNEAKAKPNHSKANTKSLSYMAKIWGLQWSQLGSDGFGSLPSSILTAVTNVASLLGQIHVCL